MLRTLTPILGLLAAVFYFAAFSSGPARGGGGDRTGSPVANGTCGSCHNGGDFGAATSIELLDGDDNVVTEYEPEGLYRLRISIATATAPGGYGYQAVVLTDADDAQAGAFGGNPQGFGVTVANGGREYLEQRSVSAESSIVASWVAPPAGTGPVTAYAAGNAVNTNGGTTGDQVALATLNVAEAASSSTRATLAEDAWRAFAKTPGTLEVALTGISAASAKTTFRVADLSGRTLRSGRLDDAVEVDGLTPGLYAVSVVTADARAGSRLVRVD